jgi:hypothetical protein
MTPSLRPCGVNAPQAPKTSGSSSSFRTILASSSSNDRGMALCRTHMVAFGSPKRRRITMPDRVHIRRRAPRRRRHETSSFLPPPGVAQRVWNLVSLDFPNKVSVVPMASRMRLPCSIRWWKSHRLGPVEDFGSVLEAVDIAHHGTRVVVPPRDDFARVQHNRQRL